MTELAELTHLLEAAGQHEELYVRWSRGPAVDLSPAHGSEQASRDALTGVLLPGLSANPLRVEPWWDGRPIRLWLARRLYDYRHLQQLRGPDVRPWVLVGEERGRGPDNEPLVVCRRAVAWIADAVLEEVEQIVHAQGSAEWGPLDRSSHRLPDEPDTEARG
jgi:hypothetical protein